MDLRDASLGFYRVWYAAVGIENGLLPQRTKARALDAGMVERYYRGAHALGLVERRGGGWRLTPEHARTLGDPSDPAYLGAHFRYLARKSLRFGDLGALLATGRAPRNGDLADVYAIATSWDHVAFFEDVLPRERATLALLREGCDVLDLGAGLGSWSLEAARRFPRSRITAAETRSALPALRRALRGSRVRAIDAARVPTASFDVVFLGEVLAAATTPEAPLRAAARALRPGGWMHALEGLRPDGEPRGWGERLVLAMDLDFALDGSRFLSVAEAERALARASGLAARRLRDVDGSLYHIRARRRKLQTRARG
jgi:SAM-dependent methyltransferase